MTVNELITTVNDIIWSYVLIVALVGCGLWFTWRTRFAQFRMVGEMIRLLTDSTVGTVKDQAKGERVRRVSSFQAFAVSVATRVGTGNLAGVAVAIAIGGPGAVFWMWVIALIGSATAFVGLSNNSIQANTICGAMQEAFGWSPVWVGILLAAMALFIVFGGIWRIAQVSAVLVPFMAIGYLVLTVVIIMMNYHLIPHVFKIIVLDAFGFTQIAGGGIGAAMMNGIKRGLFSNEAGEGSAPNVAATAVTTHPVKQGLIQALGVFTDTLVVCSCTAFIILISGLYQDSASSGIALTQSALQNEVGSFGPIFVAIAIFLFAFSSIIGNYYYGEANIRFITSNETVITIYRICSAGLMVIFGAVASFELVWNLVDFFMAFLTACNLVAITLLGRYAFRLLDDYRQQKRNGIKEPVFHRSKLPEIENDIECWD